MSENRKIPCEMGTLDMKCGNEVTIGTPEEIEGHRIETTLKKHYRRS